MDILDYQAQVMRALAHPRRLAILHELERSPIEVGKLAATLGISQPSCSQHLAAMLAVGIVVAERDGQKIRYSLADPAVMTACGIMRGVLARRMERMSQIVMTNEPAPSLAEVASL